MAEVENFDVVSKADINEEGTEIQNKEVLL
jgi:hypothetical protein